MEDARNLGAVSLATLEGGRTTLDQAALASFAHGLRGRLLLTSDPGFDEVREIFNGICDKRPGLIVQCRGVADVIKCVNLAREHDLLISVRGGGHHMSGFALCDGGMMIDLSPMKSVHIDPAKRTARAEPGCTLFDLDTECQAFGLAVPSGIVSNTGIAGLSLGGGLGWLMRSCGLTIDNILEFDIVTADGRLRRASADEHPDLYWALRGGGGNFGVVTSFKYRLHPVDTVTAGWIHYPIEKAREVLGFCREFVAECSDRVVADGGFWMLPGGTKTCAVAVCYNGPADEAAEALRPLRQFGVAPTGDDVRPMGYLELQSMLDQAVLPGLRYHQKDRFIAKITDELIDTIGLHFQTLPAAEGIGGGLRVVAGFRFLAGAVSRVGAGETAFSHREKQFSFEITTTWDDPADDAANIAWTDALYAATAPFSSHGHYINGHVGSAGESARDIYSPECYQRLASIKSIYDPGNMFRNNFNIEPGG